MTEEIDNIETVAASGNNMADNSKEDAYIANNSRELVTIERSNKVSEPKTLHRQASDVLQKMDEGTCQSDLMGAGT